MPKNHGLFGSLRLCGLLGPEPRPESALFGRPGGATRAPRQRGSRNLKLGFHQHSQKQNRVLKKGAWHKPTGIIEEASMITSMVAIKSEDGGPVRGFNGGGSRRPLQSCPAEPTKRSFGLTRLWLLLQGGFFTSLLQRADSSYSVPELCDVSLVSKTPSCNIGPKS